MTKLIYFVKTSYGNTIIEPTTLSGPTENDLLKSSDLRSAAGQEYR